MRYSIFFVLKLAVSTSLAYAQPLLLELSLEAPNCKTLANKPLPTKYYDFAKKQKEFNWVKRVRSSDIQASGKGYERVDGSEMYDWYTFDKIDVDGDGVCDWFLTSIAPYSTGGDSGVLNTIYLGSQKGWSRFGATIANDQPDGLGWGKSSSEQSQFAFSSEVPLTIWDRKSQKPYLIGVFANRRDSGRIDHDGYHIYTWSSANNKLNELDKWQPGSIAAQVYKYFKQHGAVDTSGTGVDRTGKYDPDVEKSELDHGCKNESVLKLSTHFANACKSR